MSDPLDIAKEYFDLSNQSNFAGIRELLTTSTTYSSVNTGIYLGAESIVKMQKEFHGSFKSLKWIIHSVEEVKPGIVLFEYDFKAVKKDGTKTESSGLEYVVVLNGKIQHIEIRNKVLV